MARKWLLMHGKPSKRPKKGLWWVFTPSRHTFRCWAKIQKFTVFHYLTCHITHNQHVEVCRMGAYTHPKPFFWKISIFLKKIEHFWYLCYLWVTKTHRVLWSAKCARTCFFMLNGGFRRHSFGTMMTPHELKSKKSVLEIWNESMRRILSRRVR